MLSRILVVVALWASIFKTVHSDALWDSLNGVQQLMTGNANFDKEFYDSLVKCLDDLDPDLLESVNAQWMGFMKYAESGGNPGIDDWQRCPDTRWFEGNCTVQEYGNIPIWEPCNYASNIAYYRTTVEICSRNWYNEKWNMPDNSVKSIGKAFASLGLGSSFFHGSQTKVGDISDVRVNDLFGYIIHQEMVQKLTAGDPSIIHELNYTPRSISAVDVIDYLMHAYINEPVEDWGNILDSADFPSLFHSMCGVFGTIFTLILPEEVVDALVNELLVIFNGFDDGMKEFCVDNFIPQIRIATVNMRPLPEAEVGQLRSNTVGTLIKLFYAFVWQEDALLNTTLLLGPKVNELGAKLLPAVNKAATHLTNFQHSPTFDQSGLDFYPGDEECNSWDPHAKWHLETGIALPDLVFLADEVYRLIDTYL